MGYEDLEETRVAIEKIQKSIHGIDFDFVIADFDRQVKNNREYYDIAMMAHANNIENLLLQLQEEYKGFIIAGRKNQNPKKLEIERKLDELKRFKR